MLVLAFAAVLAVQFSNTITLGAGITLIAVLALGGIFTLRSRLGAYWKSAYEEQQARAESEREQKHELKSELAAERLKTDLTEVVKAMNSQHNDLIARMLEGRQTATDEVGTVLEGMETRLSKQHEAILAAQQAQTVVLQALADRIGEKVGEKLDEHAHQVADAVGQQLEEKLGNGGP